MKKRFSSLTLFGLTAALLALMGVVTALAAPAATHEVTTHVDGTYVTDKPPVWATDGTVIDININDADRNVSVDRTANFTVADGAGNGKTTVTGPWAGTGTTADIDLLLAGEDEGEGTPGPAIVSGSIKVNVPARDSATFTVVEDILDRGIFRVRNFGAAVATGTAFTITYKQAQVNSLTDPADATKKLVAVKSTQDPTGFTVTMNETNATSGQFNGKVKLTKTPIATATPQELKVALTGDVVTITYTDKTPAGSTGITTSKSIVATVTIDLTKPVISNVSPANKLSTQILKPDFTADFNDSHSGINVNELKLELDGSTTNNTCTTTDLGGGAWRLACKPSADLAVGPHTWQFIAKDKAGVTGKTDANTASSAPGDQAFDLTVDLAPPSTDFTGKTGIWWDPSKADDGVIEGITGNKSELDASKAKKNSLRLEFSEDLSPSTVDASDFTVAGNTISKAEVFDVDGARKFVFLTLGSDVGSADKPKVNLVGAVNDRAGNSRPGPKEITPTDGIGPGVTTLDRDKTLIKDADSVVITIEANEAALGGVPSHVGIYKPGSVLDTDATAKVVVVGTNKWQVTLKGSDLGNSAAAAGEKKAVYVEVTDAGGNVGKKGSKDTASTSAVIFTLDDVAPVVDLVSPADASNVFNTAPFVTVKWKEKVTITKAQFGESGKTLADVTAQLGPITANNEISYAASGLVVDKKYEFKVAIGDAVDTVGNKTAAEVKTTFTVKAKALVEIKLSPGQNLVSLPSDPSDTAINSVITSADVKSVVTYDPLNPDAVTGPWKSATRGEDGKLSGSLATIDSKHAYWVNTTSFAPIKVAIPEPGFLATPPSIPAAAGWNLVPIVSLTGQAPDTTILADQYFASLPNWVTAYTFDPLTNAWTKVTPKNFQNVVVGKGYWLYTTTAGILVP